MLWKDWLEVPQGFFDYQVPISISEALTKDAAGH